MTTQSRLLRHRPPRQNVVLIGLAYLGLSLHWLSRRLVALGLAIAVVLILWAFLLTPDWTAGLALCLILAVFLGVTWDAARWRSPRRVR